MAARSVTIDDQLDALASAFDLKDERRTGWQLRAVSDPETVAGHTWGVSLLCLVYGPRLAAATGGDDAFDVDGDGEFDVDGDGEFDVDGDGEFDVDGDGEFDVDRALRMAVVHDLAEAETGDVAVRADPGAETPDPDAKERRERAAIADLVSTLPDGDALRDLWEEYEARETPEAAFVKDMDLVDMCLQALVYERDGRYDPAESDAFEAYDALDEFFATAEPRLRTRVGRELFEAVRARYEAVRDASGDAADTPQRESS